MKKVILPVTLLLLAMCRSSAPQSASITCQDNATTNIVCTTGKAVCRCIGAYPECHCE